MLLCHLYNFMLLGMLSTVKHMVTIEVVMDRVMDMDRLVHLDRVVDMDQVVGTDRVGDLGRVMDLGHQGLGHIHLVLSEAEDLDQWAFHIA